MVDAARTTKSDTVRLHLEQLINDGLGPHDRLPTERELAEEFSFSRLTVRRALDQLEQDGVVYRVQGAGTFVSDRLISKSFELTSFSEDMRQRGMVPGSLRSRLEVRPAGVKIGYALNLSPMDPVVRISRIRTADGIPICAEDSYVPKELAPGLDELEIEESLYSMFRERFGIAVERADQIIGVTVLDPQEAEPLQVPPFSPAFRIVRTTYDTRQRAVEYAESIYRGDRYSYELTVLRSRSMADDQQ